MEMASKLEGVGLHHGQPARRILCEPEVELVDKFLGDVLKTSIGQANSSLYHLVHSD